MTPRSNIELADNTVDQIKQFQRALQINITYAALEQALRVSNDAMKRARKMLRPGPVERELEFRIAVNTELLQRIELAGPATALVPEVEAPRPTLWRGEPRS